MDWLTEIHHTINGMLWGPPMIALLFGTGLVLTLLTGGIQFRKLPFTIRLVLGKIVSRRTGEGTVAPFQALATAAGSVVLAVGRYAAGLLFHRNGGARYWSVEIGGRPAARCRRGHLKSECRAAGAAR